MTMINCLGVWNTSCNLVIRGDGEHNDSKAISWWMSGLQSSPNLVRFENLAANTSPVSIEVQRLTEANWPLQNKKKNKLKLINENKYT